MAEEHTHPMPAPVRNLVRVVRFPTPAIVVGPSQATDVVDLGEAERQRVTVVRRRTGGGVVLLIPREVAWVDVELAAGDERADPNVGRSACWLGDVWAAALRFLGVPEPTVHRAPRVERFFGDVVCFAGVSPGEVTAEPSGPKVVGISQRRTRHGIRYQCAVPLRWDAERLLSLLRLSAAERVEAAASLPEAVWSVAHPEGIVVQAFLEALDADR